VGAAPSPIEPLRPSLATEHAALVAYLDASNDEHDDEQPGDWAAGLSRWGREPCLRAALAAAEAALPRWRVLHGDDARPLAALSAAAAALDPLAEEARARARQAADEAEQAVEELRRRPPPKGALEGAFRAAEKAALAAAEACRVAAATDRPGLETHTRKAVQCAVGASVGAAWKVLSAWDAAEGRVRSVVRDALLDWLGRGA